MIHNNYTYGDVMIEQAIRDQATAQQETTQAIQDAAHSIKESAKPYMVQVVESMDSVIQMIEMIAGVKLADVRIDYSGDQPTVVSGDRTYGVPEYVDILMYMLYVTVRTYPTRAVFCVHGVFMDWAYSQAWRGIDDVCADIMAVDGLTQEEKVQAVANIHLHSYEALNDYRYIPKPEKAPSGKPWYILMAVIVVLLFLYCMVMDFVPY